MAGATGYTGRAVVAELRRREVPTFAHVRPDSPKLAEWRAQFGAIGAEVDTTPWEEGALSARLASVRPTVVFSLLGTTRHRAKAEGRSGGVAEAYQSIDVNLSLMLYRAASTVTPVPTFVYLSSIGVADDSRSGYLAARAQVERVIRAGKTPAVIARPSFITGPDRDEFRLGERVGARISDAVMGLVGIVGGRRIADRYRSTSAPVLAGALVRLGLSVREGVQVVESEALRG